MFGFYGLNKTCPQHSIQFKKPLKKQTLLQDLKNRIHQNLFSSHLKLKESQNFTNIRKGNNLFSILVLLENNYIRIDLTFYCLTKLMLNLVKGKIEILVFN